MEPISKGRVSRYSSLRLKKKRDELGLFLAEGAKCVADTLGSFEAEAVVATDAWWRGAPAGTLSKIPVSQRLTASAKEMERISSLSAAPEVIAVYRIPAQPETPAPEGLVPMLDGIQDPGNLGTILRTCDWFGMPLVYASRDTADLYNPKTVQATMGAIGRVRLVYADLEEVLRQNPGTPVYGTLLEGRDIYAEQLSPRGFILFGNEGKGVSPALRNRITTPLLIPCHALSASHSESLNVATAVAVTLAEFRRRFP